MPKLVTVCPSSTERIAREAFGGLGCEEFGVVVLRGARSWGAHESGRIEVPRPDGATLALRVSYDERKAPFVCDEEGRERPGYLVSLADEGDFLACVWARVGEGSPLRGVGIDLACADDFGSKPAAQHFVSLLFSEHEHELAREMWPDDLALSYAALFGVKEAAFKATAAPLRAWYREHDRELAFEVRHFSATGLGLARGEERDGAAQRAMDAMGIARMEWHAAMVGGMALVVACALGA